MSYTGIKLNFFMFKFKFFFMTLGSAFLFERILHVFLKWFMEDKDILMVRPPGLDPPPQYLDIHSFMSIFP